MTTFTPPAEPTVAEVVAALRSSPGPIIMVSDRAADYLEALHLAAVTAGKLLAQGRANDAAICLHNTLEVLAK